MIPIRPMRTVRPSSKRWLLGQNAVVVGGPAGRSYLWERIDGRSHLDFLPAGDPRWELVEAVHQGDRIDVRAGPAGGVRYQGMPSSTRLADLLVEVDGGNEGGLALLGDVCQQLAQALVRLHCRSIPEGLGPAQPPPTRDDRWLADIRGFHHERAAQLATWLGGYLEVVSALVRPAGACHGGLHPGGVIIGDEGLRILRWGTSGFGLACLDVGAVLGALIETGLRFPSGSETPTRLRHIAHGFLRTYRNGGSKVDAEDLTAVVIVGIAYHSYLHCQMVGGGIERLIGLLEHLHHLAYTIRSWIPDPGSTHATRPGRSAISLRLIEEGLRGRRLLLGVTGSASAALVPGWALWLSRIVGAEVQTVLTDAAFDFVTPKALYAVTGREPGTTALQGRSAAPLHTKYAAWADVVVVAPATGNSVAKLAAGIADNVLLATVAAFSGPIVIAPAVAVGTTRNPVFRGNLARLEEVGWAVVPSTDGWAIGSDAAAPGAMPDAATIFIQAAQVLSYRGH